MFRSIAAVLLLLSTLPAKATQSVALDWDQSGTKTVFEFIGANGDQFEHLIVRRPRQTPFLLKNPDTGYGVFEAPKGGLLVFTHAHADHPRLMQTAAGAHLSHSSFFIAAKSGRIYLVLMGMDMPINAGGFAILTPGQKGEPKILFNKEDYVFSRVVPTADGIEVVAGSISEAVARRNASTYQPPSIFEFTGDRQARYSLSRSRAEQERTCPPWRGPNADEHIFEVTSPSGKCRTMTETEFGEIERLHPEQFR